MYRSDALKDMELYYGRMEEEAHDAGLLVPKDDLEVYLIEARQLLAPLVFRGASERYAHWTFGKRAEIAAGLFEKKSVDQSEAFMPSSPARLFLWNQMPIFRKLTVLARVLAYLDFASRNEIWSARDFNEVWQGVREHAKFVEELSRSPKVGQEKVRQVLTTAHAVVPQCAHTRMLRDRTDDLLEVIAEKSPKVEEWVRQLLLMVHKEWVWFLPMIETEVMLKGWGSWWQMRLVRSARLPPDLDFACAREFSRTLAIPPLGRLNPSLIGYRIFTSMHERWEKGEISEQHIDEAVETRNDATFLGDFLTQETASKCGLFSWERDKKSKGLLVVQELSDQEGWEKVRDALVLTVAGNRFPAFRVHTNTAWHLRLDHQFDGRVLDAEEAKGVITHLRDLLGREIELRRMVVDVNGSHDMRRDRISPTLNFFGHLLPREIPTPPNE